ncbi:hypothetical protein KKJ17_09955 [Xenorhabdus bovienii]|uniref:YopT-type cysteine protease domain-containing protein n=1 Tax=Xenorhabdus bovienii TaxID=40576 RepID=UPI0023B2AC11|nr:YopT-type cysteine protease domain-containing protein [Xenorhabdus bovienii]MDE9518054.1 hypothetical protein [Xenorhabdus bovienii]
MFSYEEKSRKLSEPEINDKDNEYYQSNDTDIEEQPEQPGIGHSQLLSDDDVDLHINILIDYLQEITKEDNDTGSESYQWKENNYNNLKKIINDAFINKLPQLIEYQKKGYNLAKPDEQNIATLESELHNLQTPDTPTVLKSLLIPAKEFIDILKTFLNTENSTSLEYQKTIQKTNEIIQTILDAIDAIKTARKISQVTWEQEIKRTAEVQWKKLLTMVLEHQDDAINKSPSDEHGQLQSEEMLMPKGYQLTAKTEKFKQLTTSLLAENRMTRQKLVLHLENKNKAILAEARDARKYAMDTLLAQYSPEIKYTTATMLNHWSMNFGEYARYINTVDEKIPSNVLQGNPLIKAVTQQHNEEPILIKLARSILPVSNELGRVVKALKREKTKIAPSEETNQQHGRNYLKNIKEIPQQVKRQVTKIKEIPQQVKRQVTHLGKTTSLKVEKTKEKVWHAISSSSKEDSVFKNTALNLLDEIQQTERRMKLLPSFTRELQEAVKQHDNLITTLSQQGELEHYHGLPRASIYKETYSKLNKVLSQALENEATRWKETEQQARNKIKALLIPIIQFKNEEWVEKHFLSGLNEELQQIPEDQEKSTDFEKIDHRIKQTISKLTEIASELDDSEIRLAEHGYAGGKELQKKVANWLMSLNKLKSQVKTDITAITGSSIDNFSRAGMLSRGISEWAEELKQDFLQSVPPEEKEAASNLFSCTFMDVLRENYAHFEKPSDPKAKRFLKRLALALNHAAENALVYPPTPEEILASSRSIPDDIKLWSEQKIVSGAISAALRGGFKLLVNTTTLPLRVTVRAGKTTYQVTRGVRAIRRGVKLGENRATKIENKYINQEVSKAAIRFALSISPSAGYGIAATITAKRIYDGDLKKVTKGVLIDMIRELPWVAVDASINFAVRKYTEYSIKQAIQNALDEQANRLASRINEEIEDKNADVNVEIVPQETSASPAETTQSTPASISALASTSQPNIEIDDSKFKVRYRRDGSDQMLTDNKEHFNIKEDDYLSIKTKIYNEEKENSSSTIKLPSDEINSIEEFSQNGINEATTKLKRKLKEVLNKKNGNPLLSSEDIALLSYSSLEMESLIRYLGIINDESIITKIKSHIVKNNYEDIIFASDLAQEIAKDSKLFLGPASEEELTAVIYQLATGKNFNNLSLTRIYNKFLFSKERKNPFTKAISENKPEGYFTISDFKKSGDVESRDKFNQQFYDYRDYYNKHDANILSSYIITSNNIMVEEFTQAPKSIRTFAIFGKEYKDYEGKIISDLQSSPQYIPGRIVLMQLSSGRYLLSSNLLGNIKSTIIEEKKGNNINEMLHQNKLVNFEKGWFSDEADPKYKQYKDLYHLMDINGKNKVNSLIIESLYGSDWSKNEINKISHPYFTLAQDSKAEKIEINESSAVVSTLAQGMEVAQAAYVVDLHQAMDETSPVWKIIRGLIPFYNTVYNASTDSEYIIDSGDILLDFVGIIPIFKAAGTTVKSTSAVINLGRSAFKVGIANGLRGQQLFKFVAKQVMPELLSESSKSSLLITKAFYDAIEPVPIRSSFKGLYTGIKNDLNLTSLEGISSEVLMTLDKKANLKFSNDGIWKNDAGENYIKSERGAFYQVERNQSNQGWVLINGEQKIPIDNSGGRWGIKKTLFRTDWRVNNIDFDNLVPDNNGIYKTRPENGQDVNYYIKHDDNFYQVRCDESNNTLRLVNPNASARSGYFPPIRLNQNNVWEFHNDVGLRGGGLKDFVDGFRKKPEEITIGDYKLKRIKYNEKNMKSMMNMASRYNYNPDSTGRQKEYQQAYKTGKYNYNNPQYDNLNSLSLDEKIERYISDKTDATTKGVLAGKINPSIEDINAFKVAEDAESWKKSANKANKVVLAPQGIYLKGKLGECLPESVLMGWALQSGQDEKLSKMLMGIYSSNDIATNPLYKSLTELHANGNASKFKASATPISDVNVSNLATSETKIFPTETSSVRVDAKGHTMLISKIKDGKTKYVFYDPNYGMAYFDKHSDMAEFFQKKMQEYGFQDTVSFHQLDYSNVLYIKISGRNLNEIIEG